MSKEDLEKLLEEKFPKVHGMAVIQYSQNGEVKHRFVTNVTEPAKRDGSLISAEGYLRNHLKIVAKDSEFLGYAVA